MLKVEILANIFELENIEDKIVDCPRISTDQLLIILSKSEHIKEQ